MFTQFWNHIMLDSPRTALLALGIALALCGVVRYYQDRPDWSLYVAIIGIGVNGCTALQLMFVQYPTRPFWLLSPWVYIVPLLITAVALVANSARELKARQWWQGTLNLTCASGTMTVLWDVSFYAFGFPNVLARAVWASAALTTVLALAFVVLGIRHLVSPQRTSRTA